MVWKLSEAKNKFSELINLSLAGTPQEVTRRNDAVIVISKKEYDKLTGIRADFKSYLAAGPDFSDVLLERDPTPLREVTL